jgi:transposase
MPHRHVSRNLKRRIPVLRLKLGFSVKEICKILGIHKSLVYQTLQSYCIHGTTSNPLSRLHCGPRKLTSVDIAFIRDILGQRHTTYLDEIQDELFSRRGTLVSIPNLAQTLH